MRIASYLAVTGLLLAPLAARAQGKPAATAKPANTPAANTPGPAAAAGGANGPAAAPAGNSPVANAPAGNAPANAPAATGGKTISIKVPPGGDYSAYIQENLNAAPKAVTDKVDLEIPGIPNATAYVLDNKTGYAARKSFPTKTAPAELAFDSRDFVLIQKLKVTATGKDDKPIAKGMVAVTDSGKNSMRQVLQPLSVGVAEFQFVHTGSGSLTVTADDGNSVTKPLNVALNPGEQMQSVTVSLPQVTATVAGAPGSGPSPAPSASGNAPAPTTAAPAPAPTPLPQPSSNTGGDFITNLVGFILLGLLGWGGYVVLKNKGVTMDSALKKLGIQPETVVAGGGSLAGASAAGPAAPPAPPPIVADPNQCPFCGQMKDAAGGCACQVVPGQSAGIGAAASAPAGAGPRLVGMAGTYMGTVFPIHGVAVIGREPTNSVPLDRDTTSSRKHAQITADGGGYRVQDLGSSNGTFVNGAKIAADTVLQPGDEVSIGGTRFRFEV